MWFSGFRAGVAGGDHWSDGVVASGSIAGCRVAESVVQAEHGDVDALRGGVLGVVVRNPAHFQTGKVDGLFGCKDMIPLKTNRPVRRKSIVETDTEGATPTCGISGTGLSSQDTSSLSDLRGASPVGALLLSPDQDCFADVQGIARSSISLQRTDLHDAVDSIRLFGKKDFVERLKLNRIRMLS